MCLTFVVGPFDAKEPPFAEGASEKADQPAAKIAPFGVSASPSGGAFNSSQYVSLTANEPATIYYTTDGTTPTTSSPVYSAPISINTTTTLKFFAQDTAGNPSAVQTETYTLVDNVPPSITITSPSTGSTVAGPGVSFSGTASDSLSGVKDVMLKVTDPVTLATIQDYTMVTPNSPGDWSAWTHQLSFSSPGSYRITARATDNAGNADSITAKINIRSNNLDNIDSFGIRELYPTKAGGAEWFVNMTDPTSDHFLKNLEHLTISKNLDDSWRVKPGTNGQVRLEAWSPANQKWGNVEITGYFKVVESFNQLLQMYARGGHHYSDVSKWCEGGTVKARLYGTTNTNYPIGTAGFVKEINHPAYTQMAGKVQMPSGDLVGKWVGMKFVVYNILNQETGLTNVQLKSFFDFDVTDSEGNLVPRNNWIAGASYLDSGGWSASKDPDFLPETCPPLSIDNKGFRQADEIISLPGGTEDQNLVAFRTDDTIFDFKYLSAREIDPVNGET